MTQSERGRDTCGQKNAEIQRGHKGQRERAKHRDEINFKASDVFKM